MSQVNDYVDYLGFNIFVGNYFVISHNANSSSYLRIGRVCGWKNNRMYYVEASYYKHAASVWSVRETHTTRFHNTFLINDDQIPYDAKMLMEPIYLKRSKEIADAK